jgi:hypothetical protein
MKLLHVCIALSSFVLHHSVSAQNVTALDCFTGLGGLGFDLGAYDRYDDFFRADSVMTLAQAGNYVGPKDIEEYVRFADASSPYFDTSEGITSDLQLKGIGSDGTCDFLSIFSNTYNTTASTTQGAGIVNIATMQGSSTAFQNKIRGSTSSIHNHSLISSLEPF